MYANQTADTPEVVKTPYFEAVARRFVSEFGDDALAMVDRAIEGLEANGPDFALEIWRDIRLTLLRKSAFPMSGTLQ